MAVWLNGGMVRCLRCSSPNGHGALLAMQLPQCNARVRGVVHSIAPSELVKIAILDLVMILEMKQNEPSVELSEVSVGKSRSPGMRASPK